MSDPTITDENLLEEEEDPLVGRLLDEKYLLETRIGVGGMATVYLTRRKHIGDRVAVKVLNTGMPLSEVDHQRFELEARSAAKIKHPNIVSVYDFGTTKDGLMYLVMELLEGSSLEKELEEKTFIPLDRAIELIQPMCEAVNAAHAEGLIHRDLKPSNILFHHLKDGSEIVKVVDFGVAKLTNVNDTAYKERLTKTGYLIGTPHYMSPEQIREQEITLRSDIYSLGVIIYEMLSGYLPFNAENVIDLLLAHLENQAKPLKDLCPNIPAGVNDAIMQALCKDPRKRQASARELFQQIQTATRGVVATPAAAVEQLSQPQGARTGPLKPQSGQRGTLGKSKRGGNNMVYDTLTGLYNSVFMNMRIDNELSESKTSEDRTAVLLFGLDNFKNINQRHGFVVGDNVLKEFGAWLETAVGERGVVGRYRGDEFIALLPKTEGKSAMQCGQEILDRIKTDLALENNGANIKLTCSAGVAQFPGDGDTGSELIEQAHLGMKQAKSLGSNQIYWLKQVQALTSMSAVYSFKIFVGRKTELEKLDREFDKTLMGQNQPVCIIGDTGVGKKRLAEEFRRRLTGKDVLFLKGRFFESSQAIPYKTIYDSMHTHLAEMLEENLDGVRATFGALADRILKDFQEGESFRFFSSMSPTGSEQEKYAIFDYLSKIFLGLAREHPLVYFLDDMQWADPLSLEFLSYLINNANHSRLLFIGSGRTEGLPDKHPLRTWLRNMGRSGCEIMQLNPLSESEVGQMVEAIFTRAIFPPASIKLLYRETKGNPYFLVELIRFLIDEGRITFRDGVWRCDELENISLPRAVTDVVEALLGRLENEALDIFAKAAIFGDEFSFELLKRVTKLDEDELLDTIDAGLKAQLIKEKNSSGDDEIYAFPHSLAQKVLYSRLNRRVRRTLHAQAGEAIEKMNRNNINRVAGELAYHFHSGGDYQKSLKYTIEAGLRAYRGHSIDEAQKYFAWGAEAAEKLGLMPGAEEPAESPEIDQLKMVAELSLNYGQLLINVGKLENAKRLLDNALELAARINDAALPAKAYNALAELSEASSQYQQSIDNCMRALEIAEKINDVGIKAISYCLKGTAHDRLGQFKEAMEAFNKAIELAKDTPANAPAYAIARRELAYTLIRQGSFRDALNYAQEALKTFKSSGDRINELISQSIIGQIYFHENDLKKASEQFDLALTMSGQLNRRRGQAIELYNISEVNRAQGHFRQAIDAIQRSLEISREMGERQYEAFAKLSLGLIYQATDSLDQALDSLNQALQQQRDVSNKGAEAESLMALAEIHFDRKEFEKAEYLAQQTLELSENLGNLSVAWRAHYLNARLHNNAERFDETCQELRASVGIIEAACDQLSPDVDRQTFLADKHEVYDMLTQLMEKEDS